MKQIIIEGGRTLTGEVKISGAKNSAVALLPAALLTTEMVEIKNVPNISDIEAIKEILVYLGATIECEGHTIRIHSEELKNKAIGEYLAKKLRASYYFMGVLLGRYHHTEMSFPGGCPIGARPIDLHLKGLEELGATIEVVGDEYLVDAEELKGTDLYVKHSVGATINLLLASVLAQGTTIIHDVALEPEVENVVEMLQSMGAKIDGKGTDTLTIIGVEKLLGTSVTVIPDRIEAGTYMILGALCGDHLKITNIHEEHLTSLIDAFKIMGVDFKIQGNSMIVNKKDKLNPTNIKTEAYPGFPTDLQQPMTTLLLASTGTSKVEETVYENRFRHVPYLKDMGANISVQDKVVQIKGPNSLRGTEVVATDLRAGACLVLAGLMATGTTTIYEVDHILRGYEDLIQKLTLIGAKIKLIEI